VAKPIRKMDKPIPIAENIRMFFRPYLSPILPQIGEKINAVTKVIAKIQPDQFCTYESEKLPIDSMYKEINGSTIVILPEIKKLANHMIAKFLFTIG
jgi:hypothetical protein